MKGKEQLFAIFGNPLDHSLSPLMHNAVFKKMNIPARYVPLRVESALNAVVKIKSMKIAGGSVTIPHKTAIMAHCDDVSANADTIGAVNTVTFTKGRVKGDNTDWIGVILALKETMEITGKTFAILGAGGAARAAVFGIRKENGNVLVVNRTASKGEELAEEFGCSAHPLGHLGTIRADCLINCTPVGMYPYIGRSPVRKEVLLNFRWVMDVIYNPLKTKLLRDAEDAGCAIIPGLPMFVHQGAEQIALWTDLQPSRDFMKTIVREKLTNA